MSLEALTALYPDFLALPGDGSSFTRFLAEHIPVPGEVSQEITPASPGYLRRVAVLDADRPGTDDWVGIGAEVDALAYLMAAPSLSPPLAVGLFGDWGSGKSFFMEALRRRIDELTEAARASDRAQGELAVFRNVAQIEFNAWHYVDGNLWASLVEHIFQSLAGGGEDDDLGALQRRIRSWSSELESERVARAEADRRLGALREEQARRSEDLARSRDERLEKLRALQETRARDALASVTLDGQARAHIEGLLGDFGIGAVQSSALETREALDDARAVLQRGSALLTPLRQKGPSGLRWAFLLALVTLSGPAVAWLLSLWPESTFDAVTRVFTGVAAFLSSLTLLLRRGSGWLSDSLVRVEKARADLERRRAERAEELAREEAGLQHEVDVLDGEVARLVERKAEIDQRIETIEAELRSLTPTRLLSDFIDERVGSDDYRKHLGVPALVRRDFRRLSTLIRAQNEALLAGKAPPSTPAPMVNRVILYIDDLDRCPPDRVVAVLQAVHLLLAFELFVVVVAVDSRWLSRSLLSHYAALLGIDAADGSASGERATPDNYLEKIFQIPFHVRPLGEAAQHRILLGLLGPSSADGRGGGGPAADEGAQSTAGGAEGRSPRQADESPPPAGREGGSSERGTRSRALNGGSGEGASPAAPSIDLSPERMQIRDGELAFMEDLRPLLGRTPRSVKRFVNVYRLMTAIAEAQGTPFYERPGASDGGPRKAAQAAEAGEPAPPEIEPYRIAMFLLAVVTGLPDLAPDVLRPIALGAAALRRGEHSRDELNLGWVVGRYAQGGLVLRPEGPSPEYRRLKGWLESYEGGRWAALPLDRVEPWVEAVRRFSFRSDVGVVQ